MCVRMVSFIETDSFIEAISRNITASREGGKRDLENLKSPLISSSYIPI